MFEYLYHRNRGLLRDDEKATAASDLDYWLLIAFTVLFVAGFMVTMIVLRPIVGDAAYWWYMHIAVPAVAILGIASMHLGWLAHRWDNKWNEELWDREFSASRKQLSAPPRRLPAA